MFIGYGNSFLKFDIFVGEKIFEMLPTQYVLRSLPQRDRKKCLAEDRLYFIMIKRVSVLQLHVPTGDQLGSRIFLKLRINK